VTSWLCMTDSHFAIKVFSGFLMGKVRQHLEKEIHDLLLVPRALVLHGLNTGGEMTEQCLLKFRVIFDHPQIDEALHVQHLLLREKLLKILLASGIAGGKQARPLAAELRG